MRYDSPRLLDQLAAAYVLGTLRGGARQRFFGLIGSDVRARHAVSYWENRLAPLAMELTPLAPPQRVWSNIEQRLNFRRAQPKNTSGWWPAMAAALALVAVGMAAYLVTRQPEVQVRVELSQPAYVSVMTDKDARPLWVLSVYPQQKQLKVASVQPYPLEANKSYELWMVPRDGTTPISLGLLPPAGEARLSLSEKQQAVMEGTDVLAVSLEPAGGSPTGVATGPVLWTAPVVHTG